MQRINRVAPCFASLALAWSTIAGAAEWDVSKSLQVGEVYSDNVGLSGTNKDDRWITVVRPSIDLSGKGSRVQVDFTGALQYSNLDGTTDTVQPQFFGAADAELIEDFFFLETEMSARQTAINPFSPFGVSNLDTRGNTTTTYDYSVSPSLVHAFSGFARTELKYSYQSQINDDDALDDSDRHLAVFSLVNGRDFTRVIWGLQANYSKTDYEDRVGQISLFQGSDNEFKSASVRLGYRFSRQFSLSAIYGKERNDFISQLDTDDDYWDASAVWTPNERVNLTLGYGERFFGDAPSVDLSYRNKRLTLNARYFKELTDASSLRQRGIGQSGFGGFGGFGRTGGGSLPFFGDALSGSRDFTSLENATFLNAQYSLGINYQAGRTSISIDGSRSEQARVDIARESIFSRYSVTVGRQLSSKLNLDIGYGWDRRTDTALAEFSTTEWINFAVSRQLGQNTSLTFNYRNTDRDSRVFNDGYGGNTYSLFLSITF